MNDIQTPLPIVEPPRKGKKSRHWREDPVIMARLVLVSELMLRRATAEQILKAIRDTAESVSDPLVKSGEMYSLATTKRDIARVKELWRSRVMAKVDEHRAEAVAQYNLVQLRAWEAYTDAVKNRKNPRWLNIVIEAQSRIDDLTGARQVPEQNINLKTSRQADEMTDDELASIASRGLSGTSSTGVTETEDGEE